MKRLELFIGTLVSFGMIAGAWWQWLPVSMTETLGFVTGAICVWLVVKQNIWNFPIGIANNIFFLILFVNSRLYGDAGLQIVYLLLGFQGWYHWLYGGQNRTELKLSRASRQILLTTIAGIILGTIVLTIILRKVNGAAPLIDAFTTVLSLAAQFWLNLKYLENWLIWVIADVIYIYLYLSRGLHLTAILYLVFLGLCISGFVKWRRLLNQTTLQSPDFEASYD